MQRRRSLTTHFSYNSLISVSCSLLKELTLFLLSLFQKQKIKVIKEKNNVLGFGNSVNF